MCPDTISIPQGLLVCIPCACAVQWFKLLIAALKCFKAQVFDPIKDRVRAAMLDLIHNEREGDSVDHRLLKAIVSVLSQTPVFAWFDGANFAFSQIFCEMGLSDNFDQAADGVAQSEITLSCYQVRAVVACGQY